MLRLLLLTGCILAGTTANAATVTIDAKTSIWGTDSGTGSLAPVTHSFAADAGQVLTFSSVTGRTDCCNNTPDSDADGLGGLTGTGNTNIAYSPSINDGISGIVINGRQMFLTGAFVDAANPPADNAPIGNAPAGLQYDDGSPSALSVDAPAFSPTLNQAFFIGDGRVGVGGAQQDFLIPETADTLLLGFSDGVNFSSFPAFYGDNVGALSATFDITSVSIGVVPLPAGLPQMLAGLGVFAMLRRLQS